MFKRRLFFLFPDVPHARSAVNDLAGLMVSRDNIHSIARHGIDLQDLPVATDPQRHDALARIENGLWYGNLGVFLAALFGLLAAIVAGSIFWSGLMLVVMLVTVIGGAWFAMRVPRTHLDEFRQALQHGEILLMVDVTRDCVEEIEAMMEVRHPEAVIGGNGWLPEVPGV